MSSTSPSEVDVGWMEIRITVPFPQGEGAPGILRPNSSDWASGAPLVSSLALERWLEPLSIFCQEICPQGHLVEASDAPTSDREAPKPGTVRLTLYVEDSEFEAAHARLSHRLAGYPGAVIEAQPLMADWRERWKRYFKPFEVCASLAIRPPWASWPARAGQQVTVIEPSMAFGTGQHPTTRLCLAYLASLIQEDSCPERLLDVGCGSGILSIAALQLGVTSAMGIDIDATAVANAQENAAVNAVSDRLVLTAQDIDAISESFPLVVANIMAHILLSLAPGLVARTAPGGSLLLSGVLEEQADEVSEVFEALGLHLIATEGLEGWVLLHFRRQ